MPSQSITEPDNAWAQEMHNGSAASVSMNGVNSDVTGMGKGVKQGCALATLFIVPFEFLLVVIQLDLKDMGVSFTATLAKMKSPTSN